MERNNDLQGIAEWPRNTEPSVMFAPLMQIGTKDSAVASVQPFTADAAATRPSVATTRKSLASSHAKAPGKAGALIGTIMPATICAAIRASQPKKILPANRELIKNPPWLLFYSEGLSNSS